MSRSSKWDTISPSLDWLSVSGCFDLESGLHQPPEGVALIGQLTSSEGWEGEGHRAGRCGGDCWQENLNFRCLLSCCPMSQPFCLGTWGETGPVSLWSERWEMFLVADYVFPRRFELHVPHFIELDWCCCLLCPVDLLA